MLHDRLAQDLYSEICRIPLIDPHSPIDPHRAAARSLDDILGYHYYTELAHSAGMDQAPLGPQLPPRERVRADDFVRTGACTEAQALDLARLLLRDNARRIFNV